MQKFLKHLLLYIDERPNQPINQSIKNAARSFFLFVVFLFSRVYIYSFSKSCFVFVSIYIYSGWVFFVTFFLSLMSFFLFFVFFFLHGRSRRFMMSSSSLIFVVDINSSS